MQQMSRKQVKHRSLKALRKQKTNDSSWSGPESRTLHYYALRLAHCAKKRQKRLAFSLLLSTIFTAALLGLFNQAMLPASATHIHIHNQSGIDCKDNEVNTAALELVGRQATISPRARILTINNNNNNNKNSYEGLQKFLKWKTTASNIFSMKPSLARLSVISANAILKENVQRTEQQPQLRKFYSNGVVNDLTFVLPVDPSRTKRDDYIHRDASTIKATNISNLFENEKNLSRILMGVGRSPNNTLIRLLKASYNGSMKHFLSDLQQFGLWLNVSDLTNLSLYPSTFAPDEELMDNFHDRCLANRDSFAILCTIILYTTVCAVGLFGNSLVIYVVLRFSKMQTVTNIYILNLAIADELFLVGLPFLIYTMRICSWKFGEYMCKAYMVSTSITQFTSSIFLLIMSADRFIAVCHPIASPRYRTLNNAKLVSAIAWLTSAVLMLPVMLFANTVLQEDGINYSCNIDWPEKYKKHTGATFILYSFFLGFATPLFFILCFYYLVIRKLHAVGKKHKSKEKKRSHRKVTRLVLTVITVYILCWLPHWVSQVALINTDPDRRDLSRLELLLILLFGCLAYSNSAMNPILYAFLSDNFRKSFFKAFTCMSNLEINAQLQVEPSVFTKHGGSRRRPGSRRSIAAQSNKPKSLIAARGADPMAGAVDLSNENLNKPRSIPMLGNNTSSATTSSTTTAEKAGITVTVPSNVTAILTNTSDTLKSLNKTIEDPKTKNGRLSNAAEAIVLILNADDNICSTVLDDSERLTQLQTDV